MKKSIASINTEITELKSSLQFMDDTVNKLKDDMNQHVEVGVYEAFKAYMTRKFLFFLVKECQNLGRLALTVF